MWEKFKGMLLIGRVMSSFSRFLSYTALIYVPFMYTFDGLQTFLVTSKLLKKSLSRQAGLQYIFTNCCSYFFASGMGAKCWRLAFLYVCLSVCRSVRSYI